MARIPLFRLTLSACLLAFAALLCGVSAVHAQPFRGDAQIHRAAASLQPGQFIWDASATSDEPLRISVSIALQRVYVYRGGVLIGAATASTGKPGKETPLGDYPILQKAKWHRSNLYSNAPMPFMQRLTWDGIALHAGWNPGYPASHGCIRLPFAFARALFEMTTLGAMVSVTDYPLQPPVYLRFAELEWASLDDIVTDNGRVAGRGQDWPTRRAWRPTAGNDRMASIRLEYAASIFAYE